MKNGKGDFEAAKRHYLNIAHKAILSNTEKIWIGDACGKLRAGATKNSTVNH